MFDLTITLAPAPADIESLTVTRVVATEPFTVPIVRAWDLTTGAPGEVALREVTGVRITLSVINALAEGGPDETDVQVWAGNWCSVTPGARASILASLPAAVTDPTVCGWIARA